jgi:hypothetical protein
MDRADSTATSSRRNSIMAATRGSRPTAEQIAGILGLPTTVAVDGVSDSTVDVTFQVLLGNDVLPPHTSLSAWNL